MYAVVLFLGLAGGVHCSGMCGPLMMGATARSLCRYKWIMYSIGRVFTYGLLGMLAGALGGVVYLYSYQRLLSLLLGVVLLWIASGTIRSGALGIVLKQSCLLISSLKCRLDAMFGKRSIWPIFILGMLNGILPCSLTYLALTYCLTLNNFFEGFVLMLIFGFGTLPAMAGVFWGFNWIKLQVKLSHYKINTILFVVSGILMITRALFTHSHEIGEGHNYFVNDVPLCW